MKSGSVSSAFPAKRSPYVLTSASAPQRASATCSSMATSTRSGHTRRTAATRTQGSRSREARSSSIERAKKLPPPWRTSACSTSAREACLSGVETSMMRTGNGAARSSQCSATRVQASTTSPTRNPAAALSRRGLCHMRAFQNPHAQVLVAQAHRARRHGHQRMVGHPRRGVDLEEEGPPLLVEHQVDAPPALAAERAKRLHAQRLDFRLLLRRKAAGDQVARVVG